jgi:hypothetical protein
VNRRSFIRLFSTGVAAAAAVASLPAALFRNEPPITLFENCPITFRGHRIVFDQYCPKNTVYFLNPQTLWVNRGDGWVRPL